MKLNWNSVVDVIKQSYERFIGTGFYFGLFLLLLLYIFVKNKEEDKYIKTFFTIYPFLVLLLILNPIFYYIVTRVIDFNVYWRVFWCMPLGITMAYGFTKILKDIKKEIVMILTFVVIIVFIGLSGKFIYTKEFFSKVDNYYKIPDEVLEIILEISNDNEEHKKVAGPEEIVVYMRQFDGTVMLEDYRNVGRDYTEDLLISKIQNGKVSVFVYECIRAGCNYVVIENDIKLDANIENYGYKKIKVNEKYSLYKLNIEEIDKEDF